MSQNVFISYSSVDEELAKAVADTLTELGVAYFFDRKNIEWGDDITDKIGNGVSTCSELLVILSPASVKSQWVPFEIGQAAALGKKVLPLLTHPSLEVPGYVRKFHYKTTIDDIKRHFASVPAPTPRPAIRSLSNQDTPEEACLEFLRLENLYWPTEEMPPLFGRARIMIDEAGGRTGWDVVALTSFDVDEFRSIAETFASATESRSREYRLGRHCLAVVAVGASSSEAESLILEARDACRSSLPRLGIMVLLGWVANRRFVDLEITGA